MASGTYFDPQVFEAFSRYFVNVIEPRNRRLSNRTAIKEMVLSEAEKQQRGVEESRSGGS